MKKLFGSLLLLMAMGQAAPGQEASFRELLKMYEYDRGASLDLKEHGVQDRAGLKVLDVSYLSPKGGRVPAYIVVPPGKGRFPGIIFMHPAGRDVGRSHFLDEAIAFSKLGAVSILIDSPFARPSPQPLITLTDRDRDGIVQCAIDLRRAVDVLLSRGDVDGQRIGYIGYSYGAKMGGILSGVEKRIKAFVLMGGGPKLSSFIRTLQAPQVDRLRQEGKFEAYLSTIAAIDPDQYVKHAAPATILFQSGRRDENVPVEEAAKYHQAASEPKAVKWYDAGHSLNDEARRDRMAWLSQLLGIRTERSSLAGPGDQKLDAEE
jgi:dienelactone hydrolase